MQDKNIKTLKYEVVDK